MSVDLLILNGPQYPKRHPNPAYKGTCRMHPGHFDSLPESHEANQLFSWFIEEGGELGIVHNEARARRLCELCNDFGAHGPFEVVEAVQDSQTPRLAGEFIGYDISQTLNYSLLWSGLGTNGFAGNSDPIFVLAKVFYGMFAKQLNGDGLFSELDAARQCRESLIALQALRPNFIEGDDLEKFSVVGLYRLK